MLVADDSATARRIFRKTVERAHLPVEVVEAENGRDCLSLLGSGGVGLALLDVFMPGKSRLEALGHAHFMGNKNIVTLQSAYPQQRCLELWRARNAHDLL